MAVPYKSSTSGYSCDAIKILTQPCLSKNTENNRSDLDHIQPPGVMCYNSYITNEKSKMKSLLLSVLTVLTLSTPAFAEDRPSCESREINHTYAVKMFYTTKRLDEISPLPDGPREVGEYRKKAVTIDYLFKLNNIPTTCETLRAVDAGWSLEQVTQVFGNN